MAIAYYSHERAARHNVVMQEKTRLLRQRGLAGGLRAVEPASRLQALHAGVGHAKALGCGLLHVRRVVVNAEVNLTHFAGLSPK